MFCPACGVGAFEEQKFCRACGMHLEVVYHLVAERVREERSASERPEKRPAVQNLGLILSLSGGVWLVLLAFIILLVLATADLQARLWNPLWSDMAVGAFGLIFVGLCFLRLPWLYRTLLARTTRETMRLEVIDTAKLPAEILAKQETSKIDASTQSLDSVSAP